MKLLAAVVALALLGGCASAEQRQQARAARAIDTCAALGVPSGSPEMRQCSVQMYMVNEQADQAQSDAASNLGLWMLANQPNRPAAPAPMTTCRWVGQNWVCM